MKFSITLLLIVACLCYYASAAPVEERDNHRNPPHHNPPHHNPPHRNPPHHNPPHHNPSHHKRDDYKDWDHHDNDWDHHDNDWDHHDNDWDHNKDHGKRSWNDGHSDWYCVKKDHSGNHCYYETGYNGGWNWGQMEGWCKRQHGWMSKSKGNYHRC